MTTPQDTTEHKIVGGAREFWFSKKTMELNAWPSHHNTLPEYEMIRWYPSNEVNDLKAKHERVLQMLEIAETALDRASTALVTALEDTEKNYYGEVANDVFIAMSQIASLK